MEGPYHLISGFSLVQLFSIFFIISAMYFARKQFHQAVTALSRIIYCVMRLSAKSVKQAEYKLSLRNRDVLMATGMNAAEKNMGKEFDRINIAVQRDLCTYPKLQRMLTEIVIKMDEDYQKCAEVPQGLAEWNKVINAIANIRPSSDPIVANMLEDIHTTLKEQHKTTLESHRKHVARRHTILGRMLPVWQSIYKKLEGIDKSIYELIQISQQVDRCMDRYEKVKNSTAVIERQLFSSSTVQFIASAAVLAVFAVAAVINFNLIALPMSEMVGNSSTIGIFRTSDVTAVFIVCLEIVLGVFLMDLLGFTHFFRGIGVLDSRKRNYFFWALTALLVILAGVESSLAFMREKMIADIESLRQSLAGIDPSPVSASKIPTIGQMILGFILPVILTTAALPFEAFILSSRTILGVLASAGLRLTAFFLRLLGNLGYYAGRLLIAVYDLVIFPGLWLERVMAARNQLKKKAVLPLPKSLKNEKVKPLELKEAEPYYEKESMKGML